MANATQNQARARMRRKMMWPVLIAKRTVEEMAAAGVDGM
jgi:hypothetical protein